MGGDSGGRGGGDSGGRGGGGGIAGDECDACSTHGFNTTPVRV